MRLDKIIKFWQNSNNLYICLNTYYKLIVWVLKNI